MRSNFEPLARLLVQSPTPPFAGATDASQEFASQVAAVSVPASQLEQHVHELVRQVEEGLEELPAGSLPLKHQVQQLLSLAPQLPPLEHV